MRGARLFLTLLSIGGCAGYDDLHALRMPERSGFEVVGDVLHNHCGSLDCHGTPVRALRVYGGNGMRVDGIVGQGATTDAEYDATFESIVLFEPEVLHGVVLSGGEEPERLTMVQKGRGVQVHKGGVAMALGSEADACVLSWLASDIDDEACDEGAELQPPSQPEP
ncbi:MAG: hypothetical protein VB934_00465 [Polyangiaceae bacterium]